MAAAIVEHARVAPDRGPAELFANYRPLLFSIAYRMLSSAADAEDAVQEAFARWLQVDAPVESPKAYLSTVVTRLCIDQLRSARARREQYVGPWLPEPIATDSRPDLFETAAQAESISLAFLVLLARLSPVERAVFLLRDVFEYEYGEIASIVGKAEANCRQILHRARQRLADRPRYEVSYDVRERLAEQFVRAAAGGDVDGLLAILAEDVVFTGDGGGAVRTAHRPIRGAANVVRGSLGSLRWLPADATARIEGVNGGPAIVVYAGGRPIQVVAVEVAGGRIARIDAVVNPAKLGRVGSGGGAPPPELPVGPAT